MSHKPPGQIRDEHFFEMAEGDPPTPDDYKTARKWFYYGWASREVFDDEQEEQVILRYIRGEILDNELNYRLDKKIHLEALYVVRAWVEELAENIKKLRGEDRWLIAAAARRVLCPDDEE